MNSSKRVARFFAVPAAICTFAGCGAAPSEGQPEPIGTVSSAISSLDYTDWSGTITTRIKTCDWSAQMAHPFATCSVDPGFVLVGGGAEIYDQGQAGGLLTASYPDLGLTTWTALSKDHVWSFPHYLRAFSIGMKLAGVSEATLRANMTVVTGGVSNQEGPFVDAWLPTGYFLVGGGAKVDYWGAGLLLTRSEPTFINQTNPWGWHAAAKDHIVIDYGTVTAYAIGMKHIVPGYSGHLQCTYTTKGGGWVNTGYAWITDNYDPFGSTTVVTSIGGAAAGNTSGFGRLLTDLVPFFDPPHTLAGVAVSSKDHGVVVSEGVTGFQLRCWKV